MNTFEDTIAKLRSEGFKLTPQRLAVIKYMLGNREHPAALIIHKDLKKKYPTLSFSTVYNTLNMLERVGEIQSVKVHYDHVNYDSDVGLHVHFFCKECGIIHDIFLDGNEELMIPQGDIDGHRIDSFEVVFKGTCKGCL